MRCLCIELKPPPPRPWPRYNELPGVPWPRYNELPGVPPRPRRGVGIELCLKESDGSEHEKYEKTLYFETPMSHFP